MGAKKLSEERLQQFLENCLVNPDIEKAMRAAGATGKNFYNWMHRSVKGDPETMLTWPREGGERIQFHEAYKMILAQWNLAYDARLREDVFLGVEEPVIDGAGRVVYEEDSALLAEYGGHTEKAREVAKLCGEYDYPYKHREREDGRLERIPLMKRVPAPATLKTHVAKSLMDRYNPAERREVNANVAGSVMVVGGSTSPQPNAALPPYHRDYRAPESDVPQLEAPRRKTMAERIAELRAKADKTPLEADLLQRLDAGVVNPSPLGAHGEQLDPRVGAIGAKHDEPEDHVGDQGRPQLQRQPPAPQPQAQPEPSRPPPAVAHRGDEVRMSLTNPRGGQQWIR